MDITTIFLLGIAAALAGAILPSMSYFGAAEKIRKLSLTATIVACALFLAAAGGVFYGGQDTMIHLFSPLPQFELSFLLDKLSAFFIATISIVSLCVAIYSLEYVEHTTGTARKNTMPALMNLFIGAMVLTVASDNTFAFLFFWEMMSLSSFFLVMAEYEKTETRRAGLFYFIMTQLSTVFLIAAFLGLADATGTYAIAAAAIIPSTIFACLFLGFAIKAGVIPFHKWLPYAHAASPSNISALMSGVMIKVAVYGLFRFILGAEETELWWGILILAAGTISAILGVIYALKEHDIKKLLAYHSIENIGIILIGLGLYVIFAENGLTELATLSLLGALFHTLNHALFKSLLFLTAGSVVNATGQRNIEELGGLIKKMPYTAAFFLVGAVSISALPPFNGFVSELLIFSAMLNAYALSDPMMQLLLLVSLATFALTSALAAACFVKAFGITFLAAPRSKHAEEAKESDTPMLAGPAVLAILCALLGILSYQIFSFFGYVLPTPDMLAVGLLLLTFYAAAWMILQATTKNDERLSETWGCGAISQNSRMEYTASGFSEPIVTFFKFIYRTEKTSERRFFDEHNAIFSGGHAGIRLLQFFEEYIYEPTARRADKTASRIAALQNGNLDTYVAYSFIAVVALLVYVGWFI